jgi:2-polyprenyl-3-methyl-5-hydroxy-6-metoxy-1,4-benzoquinol methylase
MPTSPYTHLTTIVEFLMATRPTSLLDIGLGNGKLGFIARDLLDVMLGERYRKEDWQIKIDGIEIFTDYIQDHQKSIYDEIYIGNAFDVIDTLGAYDVIILGDVLEHFEKDQARQLIDKCIEHCNTHIILSIPLGEKWIQPEIYGNPFEKHLSFWEFEEFKPFACGYKLFKYTVGLHGAILIKKDDYIDYKIKELESKNTKTNCDLNPDIREKYKLGKENISKIDLSRYSRHVANREHRNYFFDVKFKEHYRLIGYLSTLFNTSVIFDIGTNLGYSALALSYNGMNKVISYDIVEGKELHHAEDLTNIEYLIGDVLLDKRLLNSPLIMLDTDHDGVFENKFYTYLKKINYQGLLFLDDIHLNPPMKAFWSSIAEPKEDITDLGHWSGSGLVDFGI